jgi:hypothetical protein
MKRWMMILAVPAIVACFWACSYADLALLNTSNIVPSIARTADAIVTSQYDWQLMRTLTASDAALTSTTKAWTTVKTKFYRITPGWNYVELACYADGDGSGTGDPNGGSFSYKVFTCARNSSAKLVGTGTWAIGEEALSYNPAITTETALTYGITDPNSSKWGELPVVSTDPWGGLIAAGTSNDVGTLKFDARGSYGVYVECTSVSTLTNLYILARGF